MTILFMPNGEMEMLVDNHDLVDIVDKRIGFEAKQMLEEIIAEAKHNSGMELEDNHQAFEDLASLLDNASDELNKDRMNKAKLKNLIKKMENIVNQNL